ncbi:MAG: hypothetical protein CBD14_08470 [Proteobacteria bacterium TMED154]|nr:MAG: hypothetical protein CBD14_08470 [Proteobacteria bacterium TMED154]|tara:strand:+ start:621 stop:2111 length:1491 start_codon:yes stop_codon:yes gene_type:complete
MSKLTQFTVTGKEKDDFYGFHIAGISNQQVRKVITKLITGTNTNHSIYEYTLGTAYDSSTATFSTSTSLVRNNAENSTQSGKSDLHGITWNNNGTKLYAVDKFHARIIQYSLSSAYDVTSISYEKEVDISAEGQSPVAMCFNNDGTKMFVSEIGGSTAEASPQITAGNINEYTLSGAYDVSTRTYSKRLSVASEDANMLDLEFNKVARGAVNPGELLFTLGDDGNDVNEYLLTTAYDLSTASFVDAHSIATEESDPRGLAFDDDGDRLYVGGNTGNDVNQYPLVTGYDISTTQALTSNTAFRTNNIGPKGLLFNSNGTKMYVIGHGGTLCVDNGDDEKPITHITRTRNDITLYEGFTYIFDVSDTNLTQSDFKFSTTAGGTKSGGTEYTTNVTTNGTIGTAGSTVTIQIPKKGVSTVPGSAVATLYYYESNFTDTGGKLYTPEWKGELQITKTDGKDNLETRFETKEQEDIFKNSFFMRAGLTFSVDNGDLKVELN